MPGVCVLDSRMKWKTSASSTLYGSACFLSSRMRMKSEVGPVEARARVRVRVRAG